MENLGRLVPIKESQRKRKKEGRGLVRSPSRHEGGGGEHESRGNKSLGLVSPFVWWSIRSHDNSSKTLKRGSKAVLRSVGYKERKKEKVFCQVSASLGTDSRLKERLSKWGAQFCHV